jgi:hypothetical protein
MVQDHECKHEEDFKRTRSDLKDLFNFKGIVYKFMGSKEEANGNLKEADKSLRQEMKDGFTDLNSKMNWILGFFFLMLITLIGGLLVVIKLY